MERKSYDKVIKKQILRVQEHLGNDLVREWKENSEQKLILDITYYPVFQNIRKILQELYLLLAPDNVTVVVVRTLKTNESEQYYLKPVRPGDSNHVGQKRVFKSIRTTTNFAKKSLARVLMLKKKKISFDLNLITKIANIEISGKDVKKYRRNLVTVIVSMVI